MERVQLRKGMEYPDHKWKCPKCGHIMTNDELKMKTMVEYQKGCITCGTSLSKFKNLKGK